MPMGVRISDDENFCLYDSVSGTAFGPVFGSQEEAEEFIEFSRGVDLRRLNHKELAELTKDFNVVREAENR
jgi:hypothetical protein